MPRGRNKSSSPFHFRIAPGPSIFALIDFIPHFSPFLDLSRLYSHFPLRVLRHFFISRVSLSRFFLRGRLNYTTQFYPSRFARLVRAIRLQARASRRRKREQVTVKQRNYYAPVLMKSSLLKEPFCRLRVPDELIPRSISCYIKCYYPYRKKVIPFIKTFGYQLRKSFIYNNICTCEKSISWILR